MTEGLSPQIAQLILSLGKALKCAFYDEHISIRDFKANVFEEKMKTPNE